jgi:hypothetical protein
MEGSYFRSLGFFLLVWSHHFTSWGIAIALDIFNISKPS